MKASINEYNLRNQLRKAKNKKLTGFYCLDRAFMFVPQTTMLISSSKPHSGCTAIALELADAFLQANENNIVLYIDASKDIVKHRLPLNYTDRFLIQQPNSLDQLVQFIDLTVQEQLLGKNTLVIFDRLSLYKKDIEGNYAHVFINKRLRYIAPKTTILFTDRSIFFKDLNVDTIETTLTGTTKYYEIENRPLYNITIKANDVETKALVNPFGRLCPAFDIVQSVTAQSGNLSGNFTLHGVTAKGHYNFVREYNSQMFERNKEILNVTNSIS